MLFQKTEGGYKVLMFHASRFPAAEAATAAKSDQGNAPAGKTPAAKKK
jgi:hypothetical protein